MLNVPQPRAVPSALGGLIPLRATSWVLEAASRTMPLGFDRTAVGTDQMRPACRISAACSLRPCWFHPSFLPTAGRGGQDRTPNPTVRVDYTPTTSYTSYN